MLTDNLLARAKQLNLHGLIAHQDEINDLDWIEKFLRWEETERSQRGVQYRLNKARIDRFKPLAQFDWDWPKKCDRAAVESCMQGHFLKEATNIILCGPSGVGKTTLACNIAHQAAILGYTVLFTTATRLFDALVLQEGDSALRRRINYYTQPTLLVIDRLGLMAYSNRQADLLVDIISRRYEKKSTIVTTDKPFSEWTSLFPSAACVVSLVDRLVHHSEIISIEADSFRLKEARESALKKQAERASQEKAAMTTNRKVTNKN